MHLLLQFMFLLGFSFIFIYFLLFDLCATIYTLITSKQGFSFFVQNISPLERNEICAYSDKRRRIHRCQNQRMKFNLKNYWGAVTTPISSITTPATLSFDNNDYKYFLSQKWLHISRLLMHKLYEAEISVLSWLQFQITLFCIGLSLREPKY